MIRKQVGPQDKRGKSMKKLVSRFLILAMALGVSTLAFADDQKSMTGWVTETHCGAKGAKAEHADCAVKCVKEGAKWALYNPEDKSVFVLSGDDAMMAKMASMAGKKVTVKGTMNKEKKEINVATMEQGP
jgi:hypothetical protein